MFGFFGLSFNKMWSAAGRVPTLATPPSGTTGQPMGLLLALTLAS